MYIATYSGDKWLTELEGTDKMIASWHVDSLPRIAWVATYLRFYPLHTPYI